MNHIANRLIACMIIVISLWYISNVFDKNVFSISYFNKFSYTHKTLASKVEIETPPEKMICGDWGESKNVWILETKHPWARNRNLCTVESVARQMSDYCTR